MSILDTNRFTYSKLTPIAELDLGSGYESYEALRKALLTAITEGAGGFGFA